MLAAGACAAYLVMGLGDAALFDSTATIPAGAWVLFVIDIAGPAVVLALLISVRPWFLASAPAPGPPAHLTLPPASDLAAWEGPAMRAILERYAPRLGSTDEAAVVGSASPPWTTSAPQRDSPHWPSGRAPDDELLGARVFVAPLPTGRTLLLLEPTREGRLTAFLARRGEGLAALYVVAAGRGGRGPARPRRRGR